MSHVLSQQMDRIKPQKWFRRISGELQLEEMCMQGNLIPLPVQKIVPETAEDFDHFMADIQSRLYEWNPASKAMEQVAGTNLHSFIMSICNQVSDLMLNGSISKEWILVPSAKDRTSVDIRFNVIENEINEREMLELWRQSSSGVRLQAQRHIELARKHTKQMQFLHEELARMEGIETRLC